MLSVSKFFRALCVGGLILAASVLTFADTIRLKDGSVIKGRIVSFGNGRFVVAVGEGTNRRRELNYTAAEVESISFDSATTTTSATAPIAAPTNSGNNPAISNNGQTNNSSVAVEPGIDSNTTMNAGGASTVNSNSAAVLPPITLNVKVLADNTSNGWTDSKFVVRKGQRIRISGTGQISLGNGNYATPRGIATLADAQKLLAQSATGALIAVIGDDNNDFIFIGADREFVAARDGALFLGVNEGNLNDNSGKFDVKIEIQPN